MEDLEDRLADRLVARHALHPCFTLPVPRLNAVFPVDDVQPDWQRVDDALGEAALFVDLSSAELDLDGELARVLGVREEGREQVGQCPEEDALLGGECPRPPRGQRADPSRCRVEGDEVQVGER